MNFLKNGLSWVKALLKFLTIKENRDIGIKYTKKALDLAAYVASKTKTKKDDKGLAFIAKTFDEATTFLDDDEKEQVAYDITKEKKGSLKDIALNIAANEIGVSLGKKTIKLNAITKAIKFGIKIF